MTNRYERTLLLDFGIFGFLTGVVILVIGFLRIVDNGPIGIAFALLGVAVLAISIEMIAKFSKKRVSSAEIPQKNEDELIRN